jgi:hypothetical protein
MVSANRTAFLVALLGLAMACEPLSMLPGGALSGEVQPPPDEWSVAADAEVIQLETRLADPYSINIWGAGLGPDLYVATGGGGTTWTEFIARDPRVRVRIGEVIYELTAVRTDDPTEKSQVAAAYVDKYGLDPGDNWVDEGMVIRLDRR